MTINRQLQNSITVDHVLAVLNEMAEMDQEATKALVETRVPCNKALADHPTIQVGKFGEQYKVGFLGVLNGLFGISSDGCGCIAVHYELECPNSPDHKPEDKQRYGEPCKVCGAKFGMGKVLGFSQIRKL